MKKNHKNNLHMHCISKAFSAKRRRGITTVVTSAILLAAVAIMGVTLIGWANTSLFTKQVTQESAFNESMNKLNEDLLVENIWFGAIPSVCTKCILNVTLNNVGSVGLNVTSIEIKNSTSILYLTITDGGIAPSDDYSIQESFGWEPSETTDFTIITERGNIFTAQEVT
jgi:hypothetical protein